MNELSIEEIGILKINYNELELSVQLSLHGFSFCIYHKLENKILALQHIKNSQLKTLPLFFNEVWASNRLLHNEYSNIKLMLVDNRVSLVPDALYHEKDIETLFSFNVEKKEGEIVLSNHLPKSEINTLFGVPGSLYNQVAKLAGTNWFSQAFSFIESNTIAYRLKEEQIHPVMYVESHKDFIDILVLDNSGILLYNCFPVVTANDIVYFILNAFDKLSLNQEKVQVVFSGDVLAENAGVVALQKFVRQVYFASLSRNMNFTYKMQDVLPHHYSNLMSFAICES